MSQSTVEVLAVNGGPKIRKTKWPARHLFGEEEKKAAIRLFDQAMILGEAFGYNGPEEAAYCKEFSDYMGGGFADAVNSGTNAVYVALRALDLEPFTEVIVPPITDPGGCMPVPMLNCIPIPADSAPGSYNVGAEQVEARITKNTSAILLAHISGLPCDMDPIMEVARAKNIPVVEDCAQCHGAEYKGRKLGSIGDVAAFTTMSGKHHASAAQGGLVFTKREELYWQVRRAADRGKPFGSQTSGNMFASLNFNGNELQAAVGREQLKKLSGIVERRRKFAKGVAEKCRSALKSVRVVEELPDAKGSYWFLFFRFDASLCTVDKATFAKALIAEGLPFDEGYLHSPSLSSWFKSRAVFGRSGYPWTCPLYKGNPDQSYPIPNILETDACHFRLQMHENCGDQEIRDVVGALKKVEENYLR